MALEEFSDWLRVNTKLAESSIKLYTRTMARFVQENDEVSKESINEFVSQSFRDSNSFYVKYVFKYYLEFIGRSDLYAGTTPVKVRPRKKMGKHLPDTMIRKVIEGINHELYRDLATLQYATGARAREILTLKEENIDFDFKPEVIRIKIIGKGEVEGNTFLTPSFRPIIEKYLKGKAGYLFLPKRVEFMEPAELETVIATMRTYYYNHLRKSAYALGLEGFGTHDFRRNVAEIIRKKTGDIYKAQKVLRHRSIRTTIRYFDEAPEDVEDAIISHQLEDA